LSALLYFKEFFMKKTIVFLALILGCVFVFTGCSDSDGSKGEIEGFSFERTKQENGEPWEEDCTESPEIDHDKEDWPSAPKEGEGFSFFEPEIDPYVSSNLTREQALKRFNELLQLQTNTSSSNFDRNSSTVQIKIFHDTVKTDDWKPKDGTTQKRTMQIQSVFYIWTVYDYENNMDYIVVEQEITIPNSGLYEKSLRHTYHKALWYRTKDFWMKSICVDNRLLDSGGKTINTPRSAITKFEPQTVNKLTTYTTSFSVNFLGQIGTTNGISGGASYNSSQSYSTTDVNAVNKVLSAAPITNARWEWTTQKGVIFTVPGFGLDDPADLAMYTATFGTVWVWIVQNPKKDDSYRIQRSIGGEHASTSFWSEMNPYPKHKYFPWSFQSSFDMKSPVREGF
jgi:hypothetical protein